MLYLTCTTITSVDLAHYGVSRAKDWELWIVVQDLVAHVCIAVFNLIQLEYWFDDPFQLIYPSPSLSKMTKLKQNT